MRSVTCLVPQARTRLSTRAAQWVKGGPVAGRPSATSVCRTVHRHRYSPRHHGSIIVTASQPGSSALTELMVDMLGAGTLGHPATDDSSTFPPDIAAALYQLTDHVAAQGPAEWLCCNCYAPSTAAVCTACGFDATDKPALLEPQVLQQWQQLAHTPTPDIADSAGLAASVVLCSDTGMLDHHPGLPPHPERPDRLTAIATRLEAAGLRARCRLIPAQPATLAQLTAVHSLGLIKAVLEASQQAALSGSPAAATAEEATASESAPGQHTADGLSTAATTTEDMVQTPDGQLVANSSQPGAEQHTESAAAADGSELEAESGAILQDTLCSAGTYQAACLAAGTAAAVTLEVVQRRAQAGVALIRPPGHHASRTVAQSGSYFNSAAVAARAAQAAGTQRVVILDWDAHHCQGTQSIFADDPTVLVVSLHQQHEEFYPGTGPVEDVGEGPGQGTTINIAWQDNEAVDSDYLQAFTHVVQPVLMEWQPQLILVSAGFDAAKGDLPGGGSLSVECYAQMTHMLRGLAPVVLLLEGGYTLTSTARCMEACVRVLLGDRPPTLSQPWAPSKTGTIAVMNAVQVQSQHWTSAFAMSLYGWMAAIRQQEDVAAGSSSQARGRAADGDYDDEDDEHDEYASDDEEAEGTQKDDGRLDGSDWDSWTDRQAARDAAREASDDETAAEPEQPSDDKLLQALLKSTEGSERPKSRSPSPPETPQDREQQQPVTQQ